MTLGLCEAPIGELCVLDHSGDSRHIWTVGNANEERVARELFDALKKKGYMGYRVDAEDGSKGTIMKDFDPTAGKLIMAPPVQGG